MRNYEKVSANKFSNQILTFDDLRLHFRTGRSYTVTVLGKKERKYREGMMTNLGDLEISEWRTLIKDVIARNKEEELQTELVQWVTERIPWTHTAQQREDQALEAHASRLFDDPDWKDYVAFNRRYRPEILKNYKKEAAHTCES